MQPASQAGFQRDGWLPRGRPGAGSHPGVRQERRLQHRQHSRGGLCPGRSHSRAGPVLPLPRPSVSLCPPEPQQPPSSHLRQRRLPRPQLICRASDYEPESGPALACTTLTESSGHPTPGEEDLVKLLPPEAGFAKANNQSGRPRGRRKLTSDG